MVLYEATLNGPSDSWLDGTLFLLLAPAGPNAAICGTKETAGGIE